MTTRLISTAMIHSPGILKWSEGLDKDSFTTKFANEMVRIGFIVTTWPGLTGTQVLALVEGKYTIKGSTVIIDDTEEEGIKNGSSK